MNEHDAIKQLKTVLIDLGEAEKYTSLSTCIDHIRKAITMVYAVGDTLGLELVKRDDPMM